MSEVVYSLNNKPFKDFGIYVAESQGLLDKLKPKKLKGYDWAEYNGIVLSNEKTLYDVREISLKCFLIGNDWLQLKNNFDLFLSEFDKRGQQRLIVEPFGMKPLVYDVVLVDDVPLVKSFRNGQMVGLFTLKLVEPNPIKTIYKTASNIVNIQFYSSKLVTVHFGDGTWSNVRGNVNITRDYSTNQIQYGGNQTYSLYDNYYQINGLGNHLYSFSLNAIFPTTGTKTLYLVGKKTDDTYIFLQSVDVNVTDTTNKFLFEILYKVNISQYAKFFLNFTEDATVSDIEIKKASPQNHEPVIGDKYISIAGDLEDIENLTTTAELVWEKL